ncbi:hypothetical protein ACWC09_26645 [Streptomyces sp. NPDC001617]
MSAEPSHPGPDHHDNGPATVLFLSSARPRRHRSSERTSVPPQPAPNISDEQRLAAALEAVFARRHRSLADEGTALDFLITLGEFRKLLRGALEQGLLKDHQYRTLDAMLEGMQSAPGLLAGPDA